MPCLAFSQPIRRAIYTTNAIESLKHGWRAPPPYRHQVRPEFAVRFGERFVVDAA